MNRLLQYYNSTGKRKTAISKVRLYTKGHGNIVLNNKQIDDYFKNSSYRDKATSSLKALGVSDKYYIIASVRGGGLSAQASSVNHAISKALAQKSSFIYRILRKNGYITRDSRIVERKKYGQAKARKKFQFSKR